MDPADIATEKVTSARVSIVRGINALIADIETAKKRVHRAKSELGTAESQLRNLEIDYRKARERLLKTIPEGDAPVMEERDDEEQSDADAG